MQQLLQMMQKISAEPNNNARQQADDNITSHKPVPADEAVPPSNDNDALMPVRRDEAEPSSGDTPQSVYPIAESDKSDMVVTDDPSVEDTVIGQPTEHKVPEKGGVIKRWIKKAVSWIKRLVGF